MEKPENTTPACFANRPRVIPHAALHPWPGQNGWEAPAFVKELQCALNFLCTLLPGLSPVEVTGDRSEAFQQGLQQFKQIYGLPASMQMDATCWDALHYWANKALNYHPAFEIADFRQGAEGAAVRWLQGCLFLLSRQNEGIPAPGRNGVFEQETAHSFLCFQKLFGFSNSDSAGEKSYEKLILAVRDTAQNFPFCTIPIQPPYPGILLRKGAKGDSVRFLQASLNALSASGGIPKVTVNGLFLEESAAQVMKFQAKAGLAETGEADAVTFRAAVGAYNQLQKQRRL